MTLTNLSKEITKAAMYHILTEPSGESLDLNEEKLKQYLSDDLEKEIKDNNIIKAEINSAKVELTINCDDDFNYLRLMAYESLKDIHPQLQIKEIKDVIIDYNEYKDYTSYYISAIKTNNSNTRAVKLSKEKISELENFYKIIKDCLKNDRDPLDPTDLSIYIPKDSDKIKFIDNQVIWNILDETLQEGINNAIAITKNVASYIEDKGYTLNEDTKKYRIDNFNVTPYQIGWDSMYFTTLQIDDITKDKKVVIGFDTASKELRLFQNKNIVRKNNSAKIILSFYNLIENKDVSDIVLYFMKQILKIK